MFFCIWFKYMSYFWHVWNEYRESAINVTNTLCCKYCIVVIYIILICTFEPFNTSYVTKNNVLCELKGTWTIEHALHFVWCGHYNIEIGWLVREYVFKYKLHLQLDKWTWLSMAKSVLQYLEIHLWISLMHLLTTTLLMCQSNSLYIFNLISSFF